LVQNGCKYTFFKNVFPKSNQKICKNNRMIARMFQVSLPADKQEVSSFPACRLAGSFKFQVFF